MSNPLLSEYETQKDGSAVYTVSREDVDRGYVLMGHADRGNPRRFLLSEKAWVGMQIRAPYVPAREVL